MKKYDVLLDLNTRNSLSVLVNLIKPSSKILEFGPSYGRMSKYLKEQLNCEIYAVEKDEEAAFHTKKYVNKMIMDDIENFKWVKEIENLKFDYIIFADVLEHLYNPEKVLKKVKTFLKENGSILISIPNIAHNAIILGLMKNEFNYHSTGLLDNTHIRFFTQKTFEQLINKLNYYISYKTAIWVRPENTEFGYKYEDFPKEVSLFFKKLEWGEKYQLIYELKLKPVDKMIYDYCEEYKQKNDKFIQLFLDKGDNFNEFDSFKIYLRNYASNIYSFKLVNSHIKKIRLDPLNDYAIVKISNIISDAKITFKKTNAEIVENDIFYFATNDPQIEFEIKNDSILYINFEIEFLEVGQENVLKKIIERKDTELEERLKEITKLQGEVERRDKELEEKSLECETYKVRLKRFSNAR